MLASHFEVSMREHFREVEYLRKKVKEQEAVIAQLHRGFPEPGKPVYIHPADFSVMISELKAEQLAVFHGSFDTVSGIAYIQTTAMPKITDKIK
jgi:hypothetical protein